MAIAIDKDGSPIVNRDGNEAIIRNPRLFKDGAFKALVTISETHSDKLVITDHPVEFGANITDHCYVAPKTVNIVFMYSEIRDTLSLDEMFDKLTLLQSSREPFDIVTGKRKYKNMLIESLEEETTADSENVLKISANCREIIIVNSKVTNVPNTKDNNVKPSTNLGTKQLKTK